MNQKLASGQKTPTLGQKGSQQKVNVKPGQKPAAQKGQPKQQAPAKQAAAAVQAAQNKPRKSKKGHKHQQHDLIVTIDLVSTPLQRYMFIVLL